MEVRRTTAPRARARTLSAAIAGGLLLAMGPAQAAGVFPAGPGLDGYVPGEVLVKFRDATPDLARAQVVASLGGRPLRDFGRSGLVQVRLPAGRSVADAVAAYERDPNVEYAQPNYVYRALAVPNDPRYLDLWGLGNTGQTVPGAYPTHNPGTAGMDMDAESAWDVTADCIGSAEVVVAVVDTGINYEHEDLAANMWDGGPAYPNHGYDFVDGDGDPMDLHGHGTHVAGTIGAAGNNGTGTTGLCWTARIMAVRVLDALGTGSTAAIVQGIEFAVDHGARVINLSLGAEGPFDPAFAGAIDRARANGVLVVAAAGNGGLDGLGDDNDGLGDDGDPSTDTYPCGFTHDNVLCVAALDQAFALASFSNYGRTSVDVGAPGTNILSEWVGVTTRWTDDFWPAPDGWLFDPAGRSWIASLQDYGGVFVPVLSDPSTYLARYSPNVNDIAYRVFDFSAADVVTASVFADMSVRDAGDAVRALYDPSGGVPASVIDEFTDGWTNSALVPLAYELPASCLVATCSLGFNLRSDGDAAVDWGVELAFFEAHALTFTPTSYETLSGTSMATPHVAALAAMLMAYNPAYTYLDVADAIRNGGTPVAVLAGKTTTGKAANAMGALAYIRPRTGVTAAVQ